MNCDHAQAALSARMDGERLSARAGSALDQHLATCSSCRSFAARAGRVRSVVRIRTAEDIPDLTDRIMSAVALESKPRPARVRPLPHLPLPARVRAPSRSRVRRLAPVAAALVVGLVAGSLVVGGPWQTSSTRPVAAAAVVRDARAAAQSVEGYRASFDITEHGLSTSVPVRHLTMSVAFAQPQSFRLSIHDATAYPSAAWTPTNITFIENGTTSFLSGPTGCPADLGPDVCPPTRVVRSSRSPTWAQAPLAADLVVPLTTLATSAGIRVVGDGTVAGRDAVVVEVPFERAQALFPFLQLGGTWRPFYQRDRVELWLDRQSWVPLRYTVYPSTDPARRAWELRYGRPVEPAGQAIMDVRRTSLNEGMPPSDLFRIPGREAAANVPLPELSLRVGYVPVTITAPGDLRLTAAIAPARGPRAPQSVLTYTDGLTYVRIGERPNWRAKAIFSPVVDATQEVTLAAGGVGYYAPASASAGRVVAIHAAQTNLYLETNLPRARLIAVASSLPVRGDPLPRAWQAGSVSGVAQQNVSPSVAMSRVPFPVSLPTYVPPGYGLTTAAITSGLGPAGASFFYRQRESTVGEPPISLYAQQASALPPSAARTSLVTDIGGGVPGRFTPDASRLEWIRDGVYYALDAPGLELTGLVRIAASQIGPSS